MSVEEIKKYKDLLESVLTEGQNYEEMFNDMFKVLPKETHADVQHATIDIIRKAKQRLRKKDRIVWFLRQWKIGLVMETFIKLLANTKEVFSKEHPWIVYIHKLTNEMNAHSGKKLTGHDFWEIYRRGDNFLVHLEHLLSLPIPAIQNYKFQYQPLLQVAQHFSNLEEKWKQQVKDLIPFNPTDGEIIITFPDGFFWQNLNREYCNTEGKAMGHCGNSASYQAGDRVLSLRSKVKVGKNTFVRPYLTFILHSNGKLGEMKGRFNKKPDDKYHPYIMELLLTPMIKGIQGGGYAPHNNFSINDLSDSDREKLLAAKPSLGTLLDYYLKHGVDDVVKNELESAFGFNITDSEYIVVDTDPNIVRFIKRYGDSEATDIINYLSGNKNLDVDGASDKDALLVMLEHLTYSVLENIGNYIEDTYPSVVKSWEDSEGDQFDPESYEDINSIIYANRQNELSKLFDALSTAYRWSEEAGILQEMEIFMKKRILRSTFTGTGSLPIHLRFSNEEDTVSLMDAKIEVVVSIKTAIHAYSDETTREEVQYSGWLEDFELNGDGFDYSGFDPDAGLNYLYDEIPELKPETDNN